jgi:hypothetical protein
MILSPYGYKPLQQEFSYGGRAPKIKDEKAAAEKRKATWAAKRMAKWSA